MQRICVFTHENISYHFALLQGEKNKRWLSPSKSIPAMLCPPLLSRCLPLVVKSSRNMLLHTSQTPPPLLIYIHQQTRTVTTSACGGASLFFFFFFVRWFIESCNPLSYQQPLTANTSVDTLQYIKARKKKHKNRLYTATSYSSLEHKQVVNSYVFFVPGWKNAHKWFLKGKIHPNICYHWFF